MKTTDGMTTATLERRWRIRISDCYCEYEYELNARANDVSIHDLYELVRERLRANDVHGRFVDPEENCDSRKLTAHAELDSSPRCAVSPVSAGWVRGDAPRDGKLYVAMGRVVGSDEWGGRSTPFLSQVRWGGSGGWSGWVDERGMAISSDIDDLVYIDHWCDLPNVGSQPRGQNADKHTP